MESHIPHPIPQQNAHFSFLKSKHMTITKEELDARRGPSRERAAKLIPLINESFAGIEGRVQAQLKAIVSTNCSIRTKMKSLQELMSLVRSVVTRHTPCQKGCHSCCHQRVLISQTEANYIAQATGRTAKVLPKTHVTPHIAMYGAKTPCCFLVDGACAIYEVRPVACRNFLNLDIDSLLCSTENQALNQVEVPMLAMPPSIEQAYRQISGRGHDVTADIRDFFPPA